MKGLRISGYKGRIVKEPMDPIWLQRIQEELRQLEIDGH